MPVDITDLPLGYVEFTEAFASQSIVAGDSNAVTVSLTKGTHRIIKEISCYIESYTPGTGTIFSFHLTNSTAGDSNEFAAVNYDTQSVIVFDQNLSGLNSSTSGLKVASTDNVTAHFTVRYYYR